jgi:hypothetical protein
MGNVGNSRASMGNVVPLWFSVGTQFGLENPALAAPLAQHTAHVTQKAGA